MLTQFYILQSNLDIVIQDINEKHVSVWGIMCQRDGIATTPLSPILSEVCNLMSVILFFVVKHSEFDRYYVTKIVNLEQFLSCDTI